MSENVEKTQETSDDVMIVSASPHIHSKDSIQKIMWTVNLALAPAVAFSVWHFGMPALRTLLLGIVAAVASEAFALLFRGRKPLPTIMDGSAFLTGLLLAMCLPPDAPWFLPVFGSFIAIAVAKHSMGGLGYNIFNPAHIGRAALMVSWPVAMTTWTSMPSKAAADAVTSATPLSILKLQGHEKLLEVFGGQSELYKALFLGNRNGSLGETCVVLLLLGGLFLVYKGYIHWAPPLAMIATVGLLTWIFGGTGGLFRGDGLFHMMAGGLIIGAFFMITDMVTTPITLRGQLIFAVGAGIITVLIRLLGGYPEGVCYSILLMNSVTPLIDRFIKPSRFGIGRAKA